MYLIASLTWWLEPAHWLIVLKVCAGLGFVIFVHELGHFLVAKACGVKCEKFYLGFDVYGLKLCKFQWGETEYGIGILPLGGYVKMLGQDDNPARYNEEVRRSKQLAETAGATAAASTDPKRSGPFASLATAEHAPHMTHGDLPSEPVSDPHEPYDPRSYMAQSVPKRMAIISAGVIMNVIFAFLMASLAYRLGVPEAPCVVGGAVVGGAAWKADLQPGDEIVKIGSVENPRFRDLQTGVTLGDVKEGIPFTIRGPDGKEDKIILYPDTSLGVPMIGITSAMKPMLIDAPEVKPTFKFSPAHTAEPKFEPGDAIVKMNELPIRSYRDLDRALAKYQDEPIKFTVERATKPEANAKVANDEPKVAETVEITVPPVPLKDLGIAMTLGPITAVQIDSPAEKAGILEGDKIVSVDGKPIAKPLALGDDLRRLAMAGKTVQLEIERKSNDKTQLIPITVSPRVPEFTDTLTTASPIAISALGVACEIATKITAVAADSPAGKADLQPGDEIISAKLISPAKEKKAGDADPEDQVADKAAPFGKRLSWPGYILSVLPWIDPDSKVEVEISRAGAKRNVELGLADVKNSQGDVVHTPYRGLVFQPIYTTRQAETLGKAFELGGAETKSSLLLVYRFLQKIGGQIPITMLSGPFGIVEQAGTEAQKGFSSFLIFLTLLSANLAVVNFLPIPVLDGGHMVFLTYELIRRKPASERVIVAFTYAGLIFLLSLMLFVLALDTGLISRL